jgi:acyl-CoA reductase-like NAD-dependent aldehyde dehydrogenase
MSRAGRPIGSAAVESSQRREQRAYSVLHFIDGREVPSLSERTFETWNPTTGEPLGSAAFGEQADVDRAVESGWHAFDSGIWRNAAPASRAACLRRIATLIRDQVDEIAQLDALDAGKPITDSRASVEGAAEVVEYCATLPENVRGHVYPQEAGYFSYSSREPYGVVGAIAPWNFPFLLAALKTAPALAVGNSVALKPAEQTPLSTSLYARLCAEAGLPDGVLNVVHGDGATTGAALAAHTRVPKVTFTGSTDVGRRILTAGAATIKSCHLELGGKSPNIVLADADLEQAIQGSLFTSFFNSGQVCTSGSRLLVHERIADQVLAAVSERAARLPIGNPLDEQTRLGPIISSVQLERVRGYIAAGVEAGASLVRGGGSPTLDPAYDNGYFVEPTIFADVEPRMTIAQEEIFGPVLSVLRFRDDEEAIALANDVTYGLAATVWTNELDRAFRFAERLEAGIIWTNWPHGGGSHTPYEGHKQSGLGEDGGLEAIGTFTKLKVNHINTTRVPIGW